MSFDIPVFDNILSQPKLNEYEHIVIEYHRNHVYEEINMYRTVVNMEWEYNKNIDVGTHKDEWIVTVFPVWTY